METQSSNRSGIDHVKGKGVRNLGELKKVTPILTKHELTADSKRSIGAEGRER